jgi:hypothetical protein
MGLDKKKKKKKKKCVRQKCIKFATANARLGDVCVCVCVPVFSALLLYCSSTALHRPASFALHLHWTGQRNETLTEYKTL